MADEAFEMAMEETAKDTPTELHSKPRPHTSARKDTARGSEVSPESRLIATAGNIIVANPYLNPSVTIPDLCNLFAITWNELLFKKFHPVIEYKESAFTAFDSAMILEYIAIITMAHTEMWFPKSTLRDDIIDTYKFLIKRFGNLILLDSEVRMIESFLPHTISNVFGVPHVVYALLPDTPGITRTDTDPTGYTLDDTSIYFIIPPWMIFDHQVHNATANQQRLQALTNAPARYVTNWMLRSNALTGFNKILKSMTLESLSAGYQPHGNLVPPVANTWYYAFCTIGNPECREWVFELPARRNSAIKRSNVPHSEWTLAKLLGKSPIPATLRCNNDLIAVQTPSRQPDAQAGANHPNRADMCQEYMSGTSIVITDPELATATTLAYNSYYGLTASANTHIGDCEVTPTRGADRLRPTALRQPIPAWAGPTMLGRIFSEPLTATKVTYDRGLIGKFDEGSSS